MTKQNKQPTEQSNQKAKTNNRKPKQNKQQTRESKQIEKAMRCSGELPPAQRAKIDCRTNSYH
jgi:hypothetical protein